MPPFIIVNPTAGGGVAMGGLPRRVSRACPGAVVRIAEGPGGAAGLAREARAAGFDPVVAAGGDGLFAEMLNALGPAEGEERLGGRDGRLGLLPLGTGNDLARSLGVPLALDAALAALAAGASRRVDVARVRVEEAVGPASPGPRLVANALLIGYGADLRPPPGTRRRWGRWAYLRQVVASLSGRSTHAVRLTLDDDPPVEMEAHLVAVMNGRFVGGGLPVAPSARPDDGWLEVVAVTAARLGRLLGVLARLPAGRHLGHPAVWHGRARSVSLEARPPASVGMDGETLGAGKVVRAAVLPGAVEVVLPRTSGSVAA